MSIFDDDPFGRDSAFSYIDPGLNDVLTSIDAANEGGPGASPLEAELARYYRRNLRKTQPIRNRLYNRSRKFLKGGMDVTGTPAYSSIRAMANQQSDQAKDNILEAMPNGGVLLDKLADVDIDKARTLTSASSDIYNSELDRAMFLGTGPGFQSSLQGIGGLAQMETARDQANHAAEVQIKGDASNAAGQAAGSYFSGGGSSGGGGK
jgi:uncharacterized membrane protein YgcG